MAAKGSKKGQAKNFSNSRFEKSGYEVLLAAGVLLSRLGRVWCDNQTSFLKHHAVISALLNDNNEKAATDDSEPPFQTNLIPTQWSALGFL
ncbi:hypothetical protein [Desulfonatronum lacustre]|uniref:hypothetical protein n=1 Tax=Desulfonatronum lacustre TaxID=66849 RepID=UPI0012EB48C6|nr:hypothetical protein [Desulfonatronum lacustre]